MARVNIGQIIGGLLKAGTGGYLEGAVPAMRYNEQQRVGRTGRLFDLVMRLNEVAQKRNEDMRRPEVTYDNLEDIVTQMVLENEMTLEEGYDIKRGGAGSARNLEGLLVDKVEGDEMSLEEAYATKRAPSKEKRPPDFVGKFSDIVEAAETDYSRREDRWLKSPKSLTTDEKGMPVRKPFTGEPPDKHALFESRIAPQALSYDLDADSIKDVASIQYPELRIDPMTGAYQIPEAHEVLPPISQAERATYAGEPASQADLQPAVGKEEMEVALAQSYVEYMNTNPGADIDFGALQQEYPELDWQRVKVLIVEAANAY
jgi:hypothetical protein